MSLHTMPVNVGDLLRDTQNLNAETFGAYHAILYALWGSRGELTLDAETLCRIARVKPSRWDKVWTVIAPFFDVANGKITQKRVTKTLEKVAKKVATNAENGSKGGKAKALKEKETGLANAKANATPKTCQSKSKTNSPNGEGSEAKASGAEAPDEPMTVKAQIWAVGRPMFEKAGTSKAGAGSVIGALIKRKGEVDALAIITALRADPPMDPEQYLWAIIHGKQALATDTGAAPQLELVLVDGKAVMRPVDRRAA